MADDSSVLRTLFGDAFPGNMRRYAHRCGKLLMISYICGFSVCDRRMEE